MSLLACYEPALALALARGDSLHRTLAGLHRRLVSEEEIARFGPPDACSSTSHT